jgi:hypothetical protein
MKKGGLVFLSIILALVIIAIGVSAGALAYTNGVPAIKQTSVTAENTDDNIDSEDTTEDVADMQLTKSFDQFTVDNTMPSSEDKDKKGDDSDNKEGEEESSENKEDADETSESSENSDDTTTKEDSETNEGESKEDSENGADSNDIEGTVTGEEDKKEVKEEKKNSGTKYLFADSAKKKLNKKSAEALVEKIESKDYKMPGDRSVARMIINEMYAKHGAKFKDKEVQKYFNKKSWYKKIKKKVSTDKAFSKMSALEKKNIEVLDEIDKAN